MRAVQKHLATTALLLSLAVAQNAGEVALQDFLVSRENGDLRVELTVSSAVRPSVIVSHHPDRLLLQLPNTVDRTQGKSIAVNSDGVRTVHTVFAYEDGQSTDIVVDLDHNRPYELTSEGTRIVLTIRNNPNAKTRSQGAKAAASSSGLGGIFHRQPKPRENDSTSSANETSPPATGGPLAGHSEQNRQADSSASSAQNVNPAAGGSVFSSTGSQTSDTIGSTSTANNVTPAANGGILGKAPIAKSAINNAAPAASFPSATELMAPQEPSQSTPPAQAEPEPTATLAANPEAKEVAQETPGIVPAPEEEHSTASAAAKSAVDSKTPTLSLRAVDPSLRTVFRVKYVAEGVAYLDGGRAAGLKEGIKLEVQETDLPAREGTAVAPVDPRVVAELEVTAVAETSAVTEIHSPKRPVKAGDLAYLSTSDAEALVQQTALSPTRKYPAVVSFTEGDTLDDEVRDEVPRPPDPSINRARGRFGFDYMGTISHGNYGLTSSSVGGIFRGDITRINGTYWNLSGYWRGRFTSESAASQQTLQDLINRTYHLSMTYDNPNSAWVAGFGRLYLPWASSLDTIDGGYFGRKLSQTATLGMFGGSTPDPTSYDYSPDRVIGGGFVNFTGGDYTRLHYSSTIGAGISMLKWQLDRPFGFLENTISYTQKMSLYDALQVDSPSANPAVPNPGAGLSRNFLTFRVQPHPRFELDFNYTYFRDVPTFDAALIGTGLLDKYLFQGFSVGARVEVVKQIFVYTQLGQSNRTGDTKNSLNQLYGITFNHLPWWGLRADIHYAQFNSSFGTGSYQAASVSRTFTDNLRLEVLGGKQNFNSSLTTNNNSWFVTSNVESNFGPHYFIQGGYTVNRGQLSYDQWVFTLGYRFDSRSRHRE